MNANTNKWHDNYIQHLIMSILLGGAISSLIFVILSRFFFFPIFVFYLAGIIIWAVLTYNAFNYDDGFKKFCIYKAFLIDQKIVKKVVENVLDKKNLPHTQTKYGFLLGSVEIRIGNGGRQGTIIAIGPNRGSNRPLVKSLTKKIEEAFLPQGLNQS